MRKLVAVLATVGALALAGVAAGGVVDQRETTVGDNDAATVTLTTPVLNTTTAFAVGVWSSSPALRQVFVQYTIRCVNPENSRTGEVTLYAGHGEADAQLIWAGAKTVAGPWYGWGSCLASVTLTQFGGFGQDHGLVAWLVSHDGF